MKISFWLSTCSSTHPSSSWHDISCSSCSISLPALPPSSLSKHHASRAGFCPYPFFCSHAFPSCSLLYKVQAPFLRLFKHQQKLLPSSLLAKHYSGRPRHYAQTGCKYEEAARGLVRALSPKACENSEVRHEAAGESGTFV